MRGKRAEDEHRWEQAHEEMLHASRWPIADHRELHNARRREARARARLWRDSIECAHCGQAFLPGRSDQRYCSTAHRVAAHRAK